ncbi:MAG: hypothetical protein KC917_03945, partial [Candidatus Omnitrophica bacterium]|nr:hypothetical protein [Candidatus Omnitrophota bacterium]
MVIGRTPPNWGFCLRHESGLRRVTLLGCAENESGIPTQVWGDVHEDQVIEDLGWAPRLRKPLLALCGAGVVGLLLLMA